MELQNDFKVVLKSTRFEFVVGEGSVLREIIWRERKASKISRKTITRSSKTFLSLSHSFLILSGCSSLLVHLLSS